MKKPLFSAILFLLLFAVTYLTLSFLIPGLRIKLDATPMTYFLSSLTHMAFFKFLLSLPAALIAAAMPWFFRKHT